MKNARTDIGVAVRGPAAPAPDPPRRDVSAPDRPDLRTPMTTGPGHSPHGHRSVPHTGDLRVEAWAPTREECIAEAVRGMVASFADLPADASCVARECVVAAAETTAGSWSPSLRRSSTAWTLRANSLLTSP